MKIWNKEEIELLYELIEENNSVKQVAALLDRTECAVQSKAKRLGVKFHSRKYTHEDFLKTVHNSTLEFLTEYTKSSDRIKTRCTICDHIWEPLASNITKGRGCPKCAHKSNPGEYGLLSKNDAKELKYPLYLYHIKLQYKDETFYKYGLTKNINRNRYSYKPYKVVEEISFEEYDAWTAICKERKLKSNYTPNHHFGGWTECYIN
ncbi:MAG: hypothetical protein GY707_05330 [Desulfobacteraceae bacterium]|nr:hypothetical protein [Desulfobacteraceae bacterium]